MEGFTARGNHDASIRTVMASCLTFLYFAAGVCIARAQVFTVGPEEIPSKYSAVHRTHVDLASQPIDAQNRQELVRILDAEQGYTMRPLPKGSKGISLMANGPTTPSGTEYMKALQEHGTAFDAAQRVAITDVKIASDKIIFELNGGPDRKHKILRHISVGVGGMEVPLARSDGPEPTGARITLQFEKFVPRMTGKQAKELLSPLIDFNVKTPVQAYTDTLPPALRDAILNHHVLVGMSPEMVIHAVGKPDSKSREIEGNMPFEEWIYGEPPKDVEFVRFNGNRVIRVEDAKMGQPLVVRTENEMGDYWSTVPNPNVHEVQLGDVNARSVAQQSAPTAPPTLRKPGETLPADNNPNNPSMQPVQFPKDMDKNKQQSPATVPPAATPAPANGSPPPDSAPPNQFIARAD